MAHAGDLWCYRVKLANEGLLLPGQSRNDPGLQLLRERRSDEDGVASEAYEQEMQDEMDNFPDYADNSYGNAEPPVQSMQPNTRDPDSIDPETRRADLPDLPDDVPARDEPAQNVLSELFNEEWFPGTFFNAEENAEEMDTGVDNRNEITEKNVEETTEAVASQQNLTGSKMMDLNSTEFQLKFNPRHRYDNFLKTRTPEEEAEKMKGPG